MAPHLEHDGLVSYALTGSGVMLGFMVLDDAKLLEENGWVERLAELSRLESGWLDGEGKVITAAALQASEKVLLDASNLGLSRPGIFPTPQGGIHLEWDGSRDPDIEVHPGGQIEAYSDDLEGGAP